MIDVYSGNRQAPHLAKSTQKIKQRNGIRPTGKTYQNAIPIGEQVAVSDGLVDPERNIHGDKIRSRPANETTNRSQPEWVTEAEPGLAGGGYSTKILDNWA
jgi:hypothetical protein